jgi:hypothetical protein
VGVGALGGIAVGDGRGLADFHVKAYGQLLGRIAGGVITGLIFKSAANDVFARLHGTQRANEHVDVEVSREDIQFFVGRKREAHVLSVRVASFADDDVGRGVDFEDGRNQEFRFRLIRVDVVSAGDVEGKRDGRGFALYGGDERSGGHLDDRALRAEVFLGGNQCGKQEDCASDKNSHFGGPHQAAIQLLPSTRALLISRRVMTSFRVTLRTASFVVTSEPVRDGPGSWPV